VTDRTRLESAAAIIRNAGSLALACHIGPDGDALGSMLGFGVAAASAGKQVVASFGAPFVVPDNLAFLPTSILVPPQEFPEAPEVMISFDAGSLDRLGELAPAAGKAGKAIVIDHHVTNEGFGDVEIIDSGAAATGELVAQLLATLGWPITSEIATCLHTALVTDTGRFQYSNTRPETLELAARLVAAGADPAEISRHVYDEAPFGYLKVAGAALSRAELDVAKGVVSAYVTQSDLNEAGIDWGDIDNLINTIRLAMEADVAVLAKVHDDGRVKLSLRSRGATDVGSLAAAMGGGGHRLAAGVTYVGEVADAFEEVRKRVGDFR
jgi:bifunctional oligoribonuclease and PAP phosphatase NrnA